MTLKEAIEIGEIMKQEACSYAIERGGRAFHLVHVYFDAYPIGGRYGVSLYLPMEEVGMSDRRCNKYGCGGEMRPTRRLDDFPYNDEQYRMRYYRCVLCGNETPWLADPDPDNTSFGRVHVLRSGGHSGGSMMSDPRFYPPKLVRPRRRG